MGFFSHLFSRKPAAPAWASFFSAEHYARFIELVMADFAARGKTPTLVDGTVHVAGEEGSNGLLNLAQICHAVDDLNDWPRVIREHFDRLERTREQLAAFEANKQDFNAAKPFLTVRLYPVANADQVGRDNMVWREDLEGTVTALVMDLPDAIMTVAPSMAEAWGVSKDDLFATAVAWLRADDTCEVGKTELNGTTVHLVAGDGFYAASQVVRFAELEGFSGRFGALVATPHRHGLLAYPIDGAGVLDALKVLIPAVRNLYQQGPGSISPDLFWFHEGVFTRLPVTVEGKQLQFMPPAEFTAMLGKVVEQGGMVA